MPESTQFNNQYTIAIIGIGPRGISVFERVLAHAKQLPKLQLHVLLFDRTELGPGCHETRQSPALILNTAADQITMFPSYSEGDIAPRTIGPSFDQWLAQKFSVDDADAKTQFKDTYQPRAIFGEYLKHSVAHLLTEVPPNVYVQTFNNEVSSIAKTEDGSWSVYTEDTVYTNIHFIHITTGHTIPLEAETAAEPSTSSLINHPYPVSSRVAHVSNDVTIAIEGFGLTTFDLIAELTVGRGGKFVSKPGSPIPEYIASGREPKILTFSRSGLPLQARPANFKMLTNHPKVTWFTQEVADTLCRKGSIDFASEVLPMLIKDMEEAYYLAMIRNGQLDREVLLAANWVVKAASLLSEDNRFNWEKLVHPIPREVQIDQKTYSAFFTAYLKADVYNSESGNLLNPVKAACDVLRDLRERIAQVVDFKGLSGESQQWFYTEFQPLLKRLSVGPPRIRICQLVALIEAGVVIADFGPGAYCKKVSDGWLVCSSIWSNYSIAADILIRARIPSPGSDTDSKLLKNLFSSGYAKRFTNGIFSFGGIEINKKMQVISADNKVTPNLWANGVATEGSQFYTFVLPRPGAPARFEACTEIAVRDMFLRINKLQKQTTSSSVSFAEEVSQEVELDK